MGLIFLVLVVFFYFYPYQKNHKNRNVVSLLVIISILFIEWFYNHPSLRYGGYCLVASFLFIISSLQFEKSKHNFKILKNKIILLIMLSLLVFTGRNMHRLYKEYDQYAYNPIKNIFYRMDDASFDIDKRIKNIISNYNDCINKSKNCENNDIIGVKKISGMFVFFIK